MKFGPHSEIKAIHFEEIEVHNMPAIAVAALDRPPSGWESWKLENWTAWSRWRATVGEHRGAFRARIEQRLRIDRAFDLKDGLLPGGIEGELVFVYVGAAYWQRSAARLPGTA